MSEKKMKQHMAMYGGIGLVLAVYGIAALMFMVGRFIMGWF